MMNCSNRQEPAPLPAGGLVPVDLPPRVRHNSSQSKLSFPPFTLICLEFHRTPGIVQDTSDRYRCAESPRWEPGPAVHLETPANRTSNQQPRGQLPWHKDWDHHTGGISRDKYQSYSCSCTWKRFIFVVCEVIIIKNPCKGIVSKVSIKLKILEKVPLRPYLPITHASSS